MFEINNSKDRLNLLMLDYERLRLEPLNIPLAEKACLDAWHLSDWVFAEECPKRTKAEMEQFRFNLFRDCPEMKILHDLSNTFKHKFLDRPKATINLTNVHRGDFSYEFSKDFNVSRLEVQYGASKIDIDNLVEIAIHYWATRLKVGL